MKSIIKLQNIPENSDLHKFIEKIDYYDSYSVVLSKRENIRDLYSKLSFDSPKWVGFLMKVHNIIAKYIGLSTVNHSSKDYDFTLGKKVGVFTLYHINESEIITGEKDSHLNFCLSLLKEEDRLILTTVVSYNNFFGKLFFFFIKPFHKLIAKGMVKSYI
jgi:hypothetical protein